MLDYVSFILSPAEKLALKKVKSSESIKSKFSSNSNDPAVDIPYKDSKINGGEPYAGPVTLQRSHPIIGLWQGSFNLRNSKSSQDIEETFFLYGKAGAQVDERLKELPSEPYTTIFQKPKGDGNLAVSNSQIQSTTNSVKEEDGQFTTSSNQKSFQEGEKTDENDSGIPNPSINSAESEYFENNAVGSNASTHMVGFGQNTYGRFSLYVSFDEVTKTFKCEKKYVTSKYKGLKRGRKPLSLYNPDAQEIDDQYKMTTRPKSLSPVAKSWKAAAPSTEENVKPVNPHKKKRQSGLVYNKSRPVEGVANNLVNVNHTKEKNVPAAAKGANLVSLNDENAVEDTLSNHKSAFLDEETGEVYEGGWCPYQHLRSGKGICLFPDGLMYEGFWFNGKEHGRGQLMTTERMILYSGEWADGLMHGHGTYHFPNGDRYTGDWREGLRHGKGDYIWINDCKYSGDWRDNRRQGRGVFSWSDGTSFYDGDWLNDMRQGKGLLVLENGFKYDGYWHQNFFEGKGSSFFPDGQEYQGSFKQGLREGRGSIIFSEVLLDLSFFSFLFIFFSFSFLINLLSSYPRLLCFYRRELYTRAGSKTTISRDKERLKYILLLFFHPKYFITFTLIFIILLIKIIECVPGADEGEIMIPIQVD